MRGRLVSLAGLLCLGLGLPARAWAAEPPAKQAAALPPYRRLLQGEDARKADELKRRLAQAWASGRFEEGLRAAEALRALRQQAQGADTREAYELRARARYAECQAISEKLLALHRTVLLRAAAAGVDDAAVRATSR
jgi:hypothetical protein